MNFEKETDMALKAVVQACAVCVAARKTDFSPAQKPDGSPVTAADYAAQFVLTKSIKEGFPGDCIVAEEKPEFLGGERGEDILAGILKLTPSVDTSVFEAVTTEAEADRFWAVDPIDGTAGFVSGGQFAVAVALIEEGAPVLGLLGCPGLGFIMLGCRGQGVYKTRIDGSEKKRIRAPEKSGGKITLCETARGTCEAYTASAKVMCGLGGQTETVRMDSQCKYVLVAGGKADVFIRVPNSDGRKENVWDHAAGAAIVCEGGGEVSDFDGCPLDFSTGRTLERNRGVVAAGRGVYKKVMEVIKKTGL